MKDNNSNKGILNKCSKCGKEVKTWSIYCKGCRDVNNKFAILDNKKENRNISGVA
jgi:uncharacterized OB-fold protein